MFFKEQLLSSSQYNIEKLSNKLFVWGLNTSGQVGPVLYLFSLAQISAGASHIVALTSDNRLLTWGQNTSGQLGTGDTINRSFPTQIAASGWKRVRAGQSHTVAIRGDGELFTWGNNAAGQLGLNNTINRSSPTQVNLGNLNDASAGASFTIVLSSNNTLFAWGGNNFGQIGDNTTISKSSPVQIGTGSWLTLASGTEHTLAIRTDFTLYGWGLNDVGQLGSPQYSWASIAGGDASHSAAIRSDGLLFTWGLNNTGQLGDGTTITKSAPVQIGFSSWSQVTTGASFTAAVRSGNILFVWGANTNGQVGDNSTVAKSSPVICSVTLDTSVNNFPLTRNGSSSVNTVIVPITGSLSGSFTGTTEGISIVPTANMSALSGEYTVEAWIYSLTDSTSAYRHVLCGVSFSFGIFNNLIWLTNNSVGLLNDPATVLLNTWYHIALVNSASGNTCRIFRNGVQAAQTTSQNFSASTGATTIGANNSFGQSFNGYISNLRVVKGVAVYTGTFTVPTSVLTATQSSGTNIAAITGSQTALLTYTTEAASIVNFNKVSAGQNFVLSASTGSNFYAWGLNSNGQLGNNQTIARSAPTLISTYAIDASFTNNNVTLTQQAVVNTSIVPFSNIPNTVANNGVSVSMNLNKLGAQTGTTDGITMPSIAGFSLGSYTDYTIECWIYITAWNNSLPRSNYIYTIGTGGVAAWQQMFVSSTGSISWTYGGGAWSWNPAPLVSATGVINLTTWYHIAFIKQGTSLNICVNGSSVANSTTTITAGQGGTLFIGSYFDDYNGSFDYHKGYMSNFRMVAGTAVYPIPFTPPTSPLTAIAGTQLLIAGDNFPTLSNLNAGQTSSYGVDTIGRLFTWGSNAFGQLGDSSTLNRNYIRQIGNSSWTQVSGGISHALAISSTGLLFAWGNNDAYHLGDGTTIAKSSPVQIGSNSYSLVSAGEIHSLATDTLGLLYGWGNNEFGQLGINQIPDGTYRQLLNQTAYNRGAYIKNDYTLWVWGTNANGQVGDGTTIYRSSPTQIPGSWNQVSLAINHTAALNTTGNIFCWGANGSGELGDNTTINKSSPVQLFATGGLSFLQVSAGGGGNGTNMAILQQSPNNLIYGWGSNANDVWGTGNTASRSQTTLARTGAGSTTGWSFVMVSLNSFSSYAIRGDKTLVVAGVNSAGQLGTGTTTNTAGTVLAGSWSIVTSGGGESAYGLRTDGTLYAWGRNLFGELGNNQTINRSSPVQVTGSWSSVNAGPNSSVLAVRTDNLLFGWGAGPTGDGTVVNRSSPVQIGAGITWNNLSLGDRDRGLTNGGAIDSSNNVWMWGVGAQIITPITATRSNPTLLAFQNSVPTQIGSSSYIQLAASSNFTSVITSDNQLRTFGTNFTGQLGNSQTVNRSSLSQIQSTTIFAPTQILSGSWGTISAGNNYSLGINLLSELYGWGLNSSGQLGINNTVNRSNEVQILAGTSFTKIGAGFNHAAAIANTNLLYMWGNNATFQLGDQTTISKSSPIQITSGSWALIAPGNGITVATNNNKLLYTWGSGAAGISADGTTITRSSPTLVSFTQTVNQSSPIQIGAESWTFITSGNNYFVALRSDSLLYSWGNNANGQLGVNDTINRSSPILIGTSSWIAVSAAGGSAGINQVLAIRSDRRLFGWGVNANGMLPTGIQGISWEYIASSGNHALAIRSNSTLWAWGQNNVGQLGLGDTINRSSPVQIGVDAVWSKVAVGASHSLALFGIDLYSFGLNNVGQLGLADTINRSSPVLVSGGQQYTTIAAGLSFSSALEFFGTARTWGLNSSGQLGDNTTINKSAPTQLASPYDATIWYSISASGSHMGAIDPNTSLVYMWGLNSSGQLGIGSTINRSNPTVLGGAPLVVVDVSTFVTPITQLNTTFSTSIVPITGSVSGVFTGATTNYIQVNSAAQFNVGTSNFTVELWFYSVGNGVLIHYGVPTTEVSFWIRVIGTTTASVQFEQWNVGSTSPLFNFASSNINRNTWYHVAWVVDSLSQYVGYLNGVNINNGGGYNTAHSYNPTRIRIGATNYTPAANFNGYISNVRIVKGVAVYTGNFLLPTSIFTSTQSASTNISAITGAQTSLLTYTTQAASITGGQQIYAGINYVADALSTGASQSFLVNDQSLLYAWGLNTTGQLGLSDAINRSAAIQVGSSSWSQVWAEPIVGNGALATTIDGRLFAWGTLSSQNLLGDGTTVVRSSPVQVTAWTANRVHKLSAAGTNINVLRDDSLLYIWGPNLTGVVGDGTTIYKSTPTQIGPVITATSSPVQIGLINTWDKVSLGFSTAAAITTTGRLYLWGSENQYGTLGNNSTIKRLVPTSTIDNSSWSQVSSGNYQVLATTIDGRLFAWGINNFYQIGDNTSVNKSSPVQIGVGSSYIKVAAGNNHSLAIRSDGYLYAWGRNDAGQLGIITEPYTWTKISTGESAALAIRADGLLYGWGLNTSGQLGDGTTGTKSSPTQIGTSSWTQVSSNFSNTIAIRSDGTLWTWGAGNVLLGDGTVVAKSSPVQIGNSSWSQVSMGWSHALAIDSLGRLYGWGIATALNASTVAYSWAMVSENNSHVAAIRSDGLLFVWGLNTNGQIGNNNTITQSSPVQIGNSSWISVSAGFDHTIAVTSNYRLFAWGNNTRYQLGDNTSINKSSPVQIGTGLSWTQVAAGLSYSMAITTNNELYGWGLGASGQTGALTQPRLWNNVDAGFSTSAAVRSDNTLFVWGLNSSGQVGDSTLINRSSPVQVPATPVVSPIPASWNTVSVGFDHTLGITTTGALYGWGNPVSGATGNYGELYSWTLVSGSGANWYGIRSDGSLWSSGTNSLGQLGLNDTVVRSSPTQVGTSSWLFVNSGGGTNGNAVFGITTDYRLFGWGNNGNGQLGTNDVITRSSPTLIDAGNPYSFVTTGAQTLAIRTNGTLWATGVNTTGQLGTNDVISRSNFVQVGTLTWTKAAAADGHTLAIRSDATLWTWGTASTNQLGNNSTVNRSSPVQVTSPGASPWIDIAGGFLYSVGITGAGLGTPYSAYVWGGNNNGATGLNTTVGNNALPTLMKAGAAGNSFVQVTTNWGGGSQPNTFIRSNNGQIWSMGHFLLIGDGVFGVSRSSPVLVAGSTSWSQLPVTAQVDGVMCAIATNNTLWGWDLVPSYLTYAGSGVTRVSAPVQVGGNIRWGSYTFPLYSILSDAGQGSWTSVEAGQSFSFGIKNNKLYGWGLNTSGQTGTNISTNPVLSPIQIGNSSWSIVSASVGGNFAGGIDSTNRLFMWGAGVAQTALLYTDVAPQWNQISVGLSHAVGLRSDGTLWTWGGNAGGQLGDGTTVSKSSPVQIGTSSWIQVATGYGSSYAIRRDGTLWSWGINDSGTLGLNFASGGRSSPTQIGTSSWTFVAAGYYSAYGILPNNQLYSWGDNAAGQLGTNDVVSRSSPTIVFGGGLYRYVHSAGRLVAGIRTDNTLWMWGMGASGGIGNGGTTTTASPVQVTFAASSYSKAVVFGTIGASENLLTGVAAITTTGVLYTWGAFANGAAAAYRGQVQVPTITLFGTTTTFTNITSGIAGVLFATDTNGNLWAWGANDFGQLGNNDAPATNRSSPVILASTSGTSWRLLNNMSNGYNGSLVNSNLDLYIWGNNNNGQLGIGDTINRSSPVQLAGNWVQTNNIYTLDWLLPVLSTTTSSPVQIGNSSWNVVSSGGSHTLAVRSDNTLWGWGTNTSYQLGLGADTITRSSPTQIGTSSWSVVSAGFDHSMAIRSDGTLWGWGNNIVGQVGTFMASTSWTSVVTRGQTTIGIRFDGRLYAWGVGTSGQLGDNSVISKSSPVLIDSGSWIFATTNVYHSAAIKSDGTLWLWGNNSQGQLGQNDVISRSSPVQVTGGGSWTQVALGNFYTIGLKVGGSVFGWGWNSQGFVGDGTTINKSSPVQVTGGQVFTQIESTQGSHNNNAWGQIFGINSSGILYTWGANNGGISGGGSGAPARSNPTVFNSNAPWNTTTWNRVFAGEGWAYGIRTDGALYVWGQGRMELSVQNIAGFGSWTSPVPIDAGQSYTLVAAAGSDTTAVFGVRSNGALYTSGWNNFGTQFTLSTASVRSNFTLIDAGPFTNIYFNMDETVIGFKSGNPNIPFYWGRGTGSSGIGYLINRSSPTQIGNNPDINTISPVQVASGSWTAVSAGYQYTLAEDVNSNIYAWGQDSSGQLGL